ncbi:MAG: ATP-dependent RecD-like DNA helicase [Clostridia bacterium]|nr:ATP-dependent RecD-like DNA helicase [Clostridia bacterium]
MELKGQIVDVIYKNDTNSYMVAVLDSDQEETTIVGYLPFINEGDSLILQGNYVTHQDYGEQFKVQTFEKILPQTNEGLEKYLANGTIKGIGPATAKKIVDKFGDETIHVLKFEPKRLAQIKGINNRKAEEISEAFIQNWDLWELVRFLEKFSIGVQNAERVYKELGTDTINKIEENPYLLLDIAYNVDFKEIDKMAMKIGIDHNSDKRIKSGIKFGLMQIALNGHTCVLKENLIKYVSSLLSVEKELVMDSIIELRAKNDIVIEKRKEEEWIYLYASYKAESNVSEKLIGIQRAKNLKYISNFEKELEQIEKDSNIELSEKQIEALRKINDNNVCIITGGPGTGKTTIIKMIINIYKSYKKKIVLCAPTGRAAKRITETTGEEAKTLHRVLEIGKIEDDNSPINIDCDVTPIDADVIIVDEMSMVDIFLMNYLVKAIYKGTKLILVGDIDQLPSVGPGSVLKELIESERFDVVVFNKIFRQAAESKIIVNSHRVNEGEGLIEKTNEDLKQDFFFIKEREEIKILDNLISLSRDRLKKYNGYDFFDNIQIITPTKKGMLGTKELNKILQQEINPKREGEIEKNFGNIVFRKRDRIMQIKNNYDIFWQKENPKFEEGHGVFNGELGIIEDINEREKNIKVKFDDGKIVFYEYTDLEQLEHAYAITIHKAQRK